MKKLYTLNFVIIAFFLCTGIAFSDNRKDESQKGNNNRSEYNQSNRDKKERPDDRGYKSDDRGHKKEVKVKKAYRQSETKGHRDYQKYNGYRERPYERDRHYEHHNHKGHRYEYHGHWRSWDKWERYKKEHPDVYREGNYYRENAHLMFRFRDPVTGGYFFFSIGR